VLATPTIDWRILRGHSVSMTLFKRSRRKRVTPDPEDAVVQRYPDGAVVQLYSVEATSSIYYATIHGLFPHPGIGDNNGPKRAWYPRERCGFLVVNVLILCLTIVAVSSNLFAIQNKSCASHEACQRGTYCSGGTKDKASGVVYPSMCIACPNRLWTTATKVVPHFSAGASWELEASWELDASYEHDSGQTCHEVVAQNSIAASELCAGFNWLTSCEREWTNMTLRCCTKCLENPTGEAAQWVSWEQAVAENVSTMNTGDWITYVFASLLLAFAIAHELEQVQLAGLLMEQRPGPSAARLFCCILNMLRAFALLPLVMACVPTLTAYLGGDALSIVFNALAVLFVVEVDDFAYTGMTSTATRHEVEAFAQVQLVDAHVQLLRAQNWLCFLFVPATNVITLLLHRRGVGHSPIAYLFFTCVFAVQASLTEGVKGWSSRGVGMRGWCYLIAHVLRPLIRASASFFIVLALSPIWTDHGIRFEKVLGPSFLSCFFSTHLFWGVHCHFCDTSDEFEEACPMIWETEVWDNATQAWHWQDNPNPTEGQTWPVIGSLLCAIIFALLCVDLACAARRPREIRK